MTGVGYEAAKGGKKQKPTNLSVSTLLQIKSAELRTLELWKEQQLS